MDEIEVIRWAAIAAAGKPLDQLNAWSKSQREAKKAKETLDSLASYHGHLHICARDLGNDLPDGLPELDAKIATGEALRTPLEGLANAIGEPGEPTLTKDVADVLLILADRFPGTSSLEDIVTSLNRDSMRRSTANSACQRLEKIGYARRPHGPNKGYVPTPAGLAVADKRRTE